MRYLPSSILASKPALKPPVHRAWDSGVLIGYTVERATERVHLGSEGLQMIGRTLNCPKVPALLTRVRGEPPGYFAEVALTTSERNVDH